MVSYDTVKCCDETSLSSIARLYWKPNPAPPIPKDTLDFLYLWKVHACKYFIFDSTSEVEYRPINWAAINWTQETNKITWGQKTTIKTLSKDFYYFPGIYWNRVIDINYPFTYKQGLQDSQDYYKNTDPSAFYQVGSGGLWGIPDPQIWYEVNGNEIWAGRYVGTLGDTSYWRPAAYIPYRAPQIQMLYQSTIAPHVLLNLPNNIDELDVYTYIPKPVDVLQRRVDISQIFPISDWGKTFYTNGFYGEGYNIVVFWPYSSEIEEKWRIAETKEIIYDGPQYLKSIQSGVQVNDWQYKDYELANIKIFDILYDYIEKKFPPALGVAINWIAGFIKEINVIELLTAFKECLAVRKVMKNGQYCLEVYKVLVADQIQLILDKLNKKSGGLLNITLNQFWKNVLDKVFFGILLDYNAEINGVIVTAFYQKVDELCFNGDYPEYKIECCPDGGCPPADACPDGTCQIVCGEWTCCYDNYGTLVKSFKTTPI